MLILWQGVSGLWRMLVDINKPAWSVPLALEGWPTMGNLPLSNDSTRRYRSFPRCQLSRRIETVAPRSSFFRRRWL